MSAQDQPIHVRWSDDGRNIRKWDRTPFPESRAFYPATSLETAACLWEAVLALEDSATEGDEVAAARITAYREAMGSASLRLTVLGWVDPVDEAWRKADTNDGREPRGGCYDRSFDWDFVPEWIAANVDWSDPHAPTVRS